MSTLLPNLKLRSRTQLCDALSDLVPFVQFKKREKHPWRGVNFSKAAAFSIWRIAMVTRVLPSRDSEIRGAIVRIAKNNAILKRPAKKLFAFENTYHDTNHADKAREQKFGL